MKGWVADQKQVAIFVHPEDVTDAEHGFRACGNLVDDGIAFHSLVPDRGGAHVYVLDFKGEMFDSVTKAAERYDAEVTSKLGRVEFLGTTGQGGSDAEQ